MRWWWHEMQAVTPTFCYELYPGWCRHLTEKEKVKKKISYLVLNDITIYWWYGVGKTWYNSNHTFHALIKLLSSVTKYLLKLKNASDEIQTSKPTIWDHWKLRQLLFLWFYALFHYGSVRVIRRQTYLKTEQHYTSGVTLSSALKPTLLSASTGCLSIPKKRCTSLQVFKLSFSNNSDPNSFRPSARCFMKAEINNIVTL